MEAVTFHYKWTQPKGSRKTKHPSSVESCPIWGFYQHLLFPVYSIAGHIIVLPYEYSCKIALLQRSPNYPVKIGNPRTDTSSLMMSSLIGVGISAVCNIYRLLFLSLLCVLSEIVSLLYLLAHIHMISPLLINGEPVPSGFRYAFQENNILGRSVIVNHSKDSVIKERMPPSLYLLVLAAATQVPIRPAIMVEPMNHPNTILFGVMEVKVLSVVFSALAYGLVILLSSNCLWLVMNRPDPRRRRRILLGYIIAMFLLSTGAMVQEIVSMVLQLRQVVMGTFDVQSKAWSRIQNIPFTTPFIIWGADGLLIWRCLALYEGISQRSKIVLYSALTLIFISSLGGDVLFFLPLWKEDKASSTYGLFYIAWSTLGCNTIFSTLIVAKLLRHNQVLPMHMEDNGKDPAYTRIISMCIDSAILIVVASLFYIVMAFFDEPSHLVLFPSFLLPHICVISPLLIVFRVAQGKVVSYGQEMDKPSSIQFQRSASIV